MTLQEITNSLDNLSKQEQDYLFEFLCQKRDKKTENAFWDSLLECRKIIEQENIVFSKEDLADLRDKSPGKEVIL